MDEVRILEIKQSVFANNDQRAELLRRELKEKRIFLLNLMSSPGSGKTTTLYSVITKLNDHHRKIITVEEHSVIGGLGEQHLDVVKAKLKNKFGVEIGLEAPRIAYRESIRKACQKQGRHKKQTGGHGQFGDVIINFEPCDSEQVVFEEKVFGGSVPKNFFPAVEKGVRLAAEKGVLAGYPVVGLKATLLDGSYHPVDSSEMAFKIARSFSLMKLLRKRYLSSPSVIAGLGSSTFTASFSNIAYGDLGTFNSAFTGFSIFSLRFSEIVKV